MSRDIARRVAALEGGDDTTGVGALLDLMQAEEAGAIIDWNSVAVAPVLSRSLDRLPVEAD